MSKNLRLARQDEIVERMARALLEHEYEHSGENHRSWESIPKGMQKWHKKRNAAALIRRLKKERDEARAANPSKFTLGQRVTKTKGSRWTGRVVGFYSTDLTPIGYCVESENEPGSVQIYPEAALALKEPTT